MQLRGLLAMNIPLARLQCPAAVVQAAEGELVVAAVRWAVVRWAAVQWAVARWEVRSVAVARWVADRTGRCARRCSRGGAVSTVQRNTAPAAGATNYDVLSGRISNVLYDVITVDLELIVRTDAIPRSWRLFGQT